MNTQLLLQERLNGKPLKVALVADQITRISLESSCTVANLTPDNYEIVLATFKPDFLFFESAWHGEQDTWRFKIASYPWYRFSSNKKVAQLTKFCKEQGIPTVFWCKEGGAHFHRFSDSAQYFDYVLTVDQNCIEDYQNLLKSKTRVGTLPFPVQPKIHHFTGFNFKYPIATFLGSYSHHIHSSRRAWQDMAFSSALENGLGLTIFDRNSDRKSKVYRYPQLNGSIILPRLNFTETSQVYKDFYVSLNVNTVTDSPSMYSRRLVEILACGGIAVTSPALSIDTYFKDYCHVIHNKDDGLRLFSRLAKYGPNDDDLERSRAGAEYVLNEHNWDKRLIEIVDWLQLH